MVRWQLILEGRVQNIGLRFRAYMLARNYPITGGIANRDDGTVELVLQGEQEAVDLFFMKMRELPYVRIDNVEAEELPVVPEKEFRMWN